MPKCFLCIGGKSAGFHGVLVVGSNVRQLAPDQASAYRRYRKQADHG